MIVDSPLAMALGEDEVVRSCWRSVRIIMRERAAVRREGGGKGGHGAQPSLVAADKSCLLVVSDVGDG